MSPVSQLTFRRTRHLTTSNLELEVRLLLLLLLLELQVSCQPHQVPHPSLRVRQRARRSEGRMCAYYDWFLSNSMYWSKIGGKGAQRRTAGIIVWRIRGYGGGFVDLGRPSKITLAVMIDYAEKNVIFPNHLMS
jgi:hypothetical protein